MINKHKYRFGNVCGVYLKLQLQIKETTIILNQEQKDKGYSAY